jgi:PAS domain S-box-containing protein
MVSLVLVENEFVLAEDVPSRLRAAGFDILGTPATGKDAIAQARELHPDVVLMDVVLKGKMDGFKAAQQIMERFDIPVIFLTAHTDAATVKRAAATTSYGFLVKPFDDLELSAAIEMAIHRHSTEAKMRESDRRIRELTESLSEVIFETDMAGNISFINRAGLKEFGYTKEQVEGGMTLYDVLSLDKHEEIRELIAQAVIDEPSGWMEVPGLRRDGSTFPISVRASLIVREGVPVGIRGIALNVTERKRAEHQLEESERRIRELTDALPEIIFETDANLIVTFASAAIFTRYGWTTGEVEGKMNILDMVAPFDRERARETISERMYGEDKGWAEYKAEYAVIINKDGSTAPFDVRTIPIIRDGVFEGLRGIAIDVTERKRAEAALIRSERRIREIADALPVLVYETDATGRMTFVNATVFDLFGYTKEEVEAGISVFQLIAPADLKRARAVFPRRMRGEDVGRVEYSGLRKDGSTFNMAARSALMRRDGSVVGQRGVLVDITERKRAEEGIKERTHTIETLNRIMTEGNRATDVQSFVEAATKLACELMHFDIGGIYLIDADARYATLQYGQGLPETVRDAIEKIPYHDAPFSAILIDGDHLFAEDYVTFLPQHAPLGVASLASVPLYSRDTIIGALNVGSTMRHTFSQTEKALLVAIGNEAGTVIAKLQADASVRAALKEKETLLKEIHHRVKNNMQVVSSLMSLQADRATNVEAQAVLTASQSQIRSMALIHEKLYSSGTLSEIEFAGYVGSLINELLQIYHVAPDAVTITTDIEDVRFGVNIAMPCALILNELVSNCLKYAFPDGRVGEVIVGMQYADGTYTLTVADNGAGFPADVDFRATGSLGMQLVTALVDQLDGTIDMNRENGTSFVISFSPPP